MSTTRFSRSEPAFLRRTERQPLASAAIVPAIVLLVAALAALPVPAHQAAAAGALDTTPSQDLGHEVYVPLILRRSSLPYIPPTPTLTPPPSPTASQTPRGTAPPTPTPSATPSETIPPERLEEGDRELTLTGSWRLVEDERSSGGAHVASSTSGDTIELTFSATHIALYRAIGPDGGRAAITIDGTRFGLLEFYFPEERWQVPAVFDHLGSGEHTLELTVSGRAHADSSGTSVRVDALDVPSPFHPTADQLAGEARSNYYRDLTGLPQVHLDRAINLAAQSHAEYDAQHHETHYETFGREGYTGRGPGDRCRYFGYNFPWYEVMHYTGSTRSAVDGWMATVYHRVPFMEYRTTHIGYGVAGSSGRATHVVDTGTRGATSPDERLIAVYPARNQVDVPTGWSGGESPNPLPDKPKPVGYPVSLHLTPGTASADRWAAGASRWDLSAPLGAAPGHESWLHAGSSPQQWELEEARILDPSGQEVPVYVMDRPSDPNSFLRENIVFIIAQKPFKAGTTYRVRVSGADSTGTRFAEQWAFTTAGRALVIAGLERP